MLHQEFKYYLEHQEEFVRDYNGKYIVIFNQELIAICDNSTQALKIGKEKCGDKEFLVQRCSPGSNDITTTFYSRVLVK